MKRKFGGDERKHIGTGMKRATAVISDTDVNNVPLHNARPPASTHTHIHTSL